jgi:YHS domain-containing protein
MKLALIAVAALGIGGAEPDTQEADKAALAALQSYIGQWKGVGQPRRGVTKDAWIERADWAWKFTDKRAAISFESPQGKIYRSGELRPGSKPGEFRFRGTLPDGKTQEELTGAIDKDGGLVFTAESPKPGRPAQIALRQVAGGDRLVISMLQPSPTAGTLLVSLAEIGYTRQGSSFGKGSTGPECIVTGGYGSMKVEHQGQTYYVCCTGCRDLFNDDPEAVLAEYKQRKAAEKAKK